MIAPPLIIWMQTMFGWRATFLVMGGAGFRLAGAVAIVLRSPERHPRITAEELALIREGREKRPRRGHAGGS